MQSYSRCAQQKHLDDLAAQGIGPGRTSLSRTAYGSVMHHALQAMETEHAQGNPAALEIAKATFAYYWQPEHIEELPNVQRVQEWLVRDSFTGMRSQGLDALTRYHELLATDNGLLLALEIQFRLPVDLGMAGQHVLTGTIDRLALRRRARVPYVSVEDFKTGKRPSFLRHSIQWTVYSWATTQRAFWDDFPDADERWQTYASWPRRGTWIDMKQVKYVDAGERVEQDYQRMFVALAEYVKAEQAGIWPLSITGENCQYCDFKNVCGGVGLPDPGDYKEIQ